MTLERLGNKMDRIMVQTIRKSLVIVNVLMSDKTRNDIAFEKIRISGTDSYTYDLPNDSIYFEVTKLDDNERVFEKVYKCSNS